MFAHKFLNAYVHNITNVQSLCCDLRARVTTVILYVEAERSKKSTAASQLISPSDKGKPVREAGHAKFGLL